MLSRTNSPDPAIVSPPAPLIVKVLDPTVVPKIPIELSLMVKIFPVAMDRMLLAEDVAPLRSDDTEADSLSSSVAIPPSAFIVNVPVPKLEPALRVSVPFWISVLAVKLFWVPEIIIFPESVLTNFPVPLKRPLSVRTPVAPGTAICVCEPMTRLLASVTALPLPIFNAAELALVGVSVMVCVAAP